MTKFSNAFEDMSFDIPPHVYRPLRLRKFHLYLLKNRNNLFGKNYMIMILTHNHDGTVTGDMVD